MLHIFSTFLLLDCYKFLFKIGSIHVQTKVVLSAVWPLAAFKDDFSKYCPVACNPVFSLYNDFPQNWDINFTYTLI